MLWKSIYGNGYKLQAAALHKTVRTSCKKMTPYVSQLNTGTIHNKIEVVYEFVASYILQTCLCNL
jgi:hypothetical protein